MKSFKDDFDFSKLHESHELNDLRNEKVIGKMKRETSPMIELTKFIALRSISFSYSTLKKKIQSKRNTKNPNFRRLYNLIIYF